MGSHIAVVVMVAALGTGACGTTGDEPEVVYDPCSPLTVAVSASTAADESAGIEAAIAAWRTRLPVTMQIELGEDAAKAARDAGRPVLPIRFISGSAIRAIYWDKVGVISIDRSQLDAGDYAVAIAHEMGHAFGLAHVDVAERVSVMNVSNLDVLPTEDDAVNVKARWSACDP